MIAIISLLLVITLSILITRVATIALVHTGLARATARFQARSAFTGAGFTTHESERVTGHPVRRRIVMMLMLLGNAGIVTAVSSLMLTFVHQGGATPLTLKVVCLVVGLMVLWRLAMSQWVDQRLSHLIDWALQRYTDLDVRDYASVLHLAGDYRLVELSVRPGDWLARKILAESRLREEGIVVLGIERPDGTYLGAPKGHTQILPQDTLLLYGRISTLESLDQRGPGRLGDYAHREAIAEQQQVVEAEEEARQETLEVDQDMNEHPR
ncbi:MAG: TrkA C-terminal domain-containing protein [Candidatus Binatia bacterium]